MQVRRWAGKARQLRGRRGKWEQVCTWARQSGDGGRMENGSEGIWLDGETDCDICIAVLIVALFLIF